MLINPTPLPIFSILPQLQHALNHHLLVLLSADPGAGKTTQVPLALLQEPWRGSKKIIMLEPRRLAARAAARRMASLMNEPVGGIIGYRTRLDTKIGPTTIIEVVTEGILTRMLQQDPSLNEYGLVIFDEFHERNLQADLGLALTLQTQSLFRKDLRILIMSATLDIRPLTQQWQQAPVVTCAGRMYPVDTRYLGPLENRDFAQHLAKAIHRLLQTDSGNLLVFLPGAGEIRRLEQHLSALTLPPQTMIAPLYGDLSPQAQDQAILPPPPGWRKIVLSTNIAESSLTIEGIRMVLDTGLMRVPRFDPRSGMSRLTTVNISQASSEQRRGRAGRTEPGLCVRCWAEASQRTLATRTPPEILQADLTSLALELAVWGIQDASELSWLDPPPAGALAQARQLLQFLGALDGDGRVTEHGRKMSGLPVHPRLAHMVLQGATMKYGPLACDLAAILNEQDFLKGTTAQSQTDIRSRMEEYDRQTNRHTGSGVIQRIRQASQAWQRDLGLSVQSRPRNHHQPDAIGILLALAYPDRIAQRQADGSRRYKMANGRLARFHQPDPLEHDEFLVIADLDGTRPVSRIYLAAPIHRDDLSKHFSNLIQRTELVTWDESTQSAIASRQLRLGELTLEESRLHKPDPELVMTVLLQGIRSQGIASLPWSKEQRNWQSRVRFLHRVMGSEAAWPDVTDESLLNTLENWLGPYLIDIFSFSQLKRVDLTWPLQALLSPDQRRSLDTLAPTHLPVPTGSRIALDYESGEVPILAVRLQELFGMTETPRIAKDNVPVLIHLLSPARRPVQVTQDLKSFWKTGYVEVRKELKGRYPKHFWPDDPLQAPPTRGIKKR
ncbi:MAG: ATP-dependent helicase HrpB [Nitrospirales bacterium]